MRPLPSVGAYSVGFYSSQHLLTFFTIENCIVVVSENEDSYHRGFSSSASHMRKQAEADEVIRVEQAGG